MNIKNMTSKSVKTVGAVAVGLIAAELGILGGGMVIQDGKTIKSWVDPVPVKVKTGFCKTKNVTINPFTGKVKDYNGNKMPSNKKALKMKEVR